MYLFFNHKNKMELYKFAETPMHFTENKGLNFKIAQKNTVIAMNSDMSLSIEMALEQLNDCKHFGQVYLCPNLHLFHTAINSTCLGALFTKDLNQTKELCNLHILTKFAEIIKINFNQFMFAISSPKNVTIECGSEKFYGILKTSAILEIEYPCTATLENQAVHSQLQIETSNKIQPRNLKFSLQHFFDADVAKFEIVINKLRNSSRVITSQQVRQKLSELQFNNVSSFSNVFICISATCAGGIIFLVAFCVWRKRRMANQNDKTIQRGQQDQIVLQSNFKRSHSESCKHKK